MSLHLLHLTLCAKNTLFLIVRKDVSIKRMTEPELLLSGNVVDSLPWSNNLSSVSASFSHWTVFMQGHHIEGSS